MLALTGPTPQIVFGSLASPVCALSLDRALGQLVSTCEVADGHRRLQATGEAAGSVELAALKAEHAALKAKHEAEHAALKAELAELRHALAAALGPK